MMNDQYHQTNIRGIIKVTEEPIVARRYNRGIVTRQYAITTPSRILHYRYCIVLMATHNGIEVINTSKLINLDIVFKILS